MEEKLLRFISDEFVDDPDIVITPDTKIISTGLIDSFSLVVLQVFIEKEFDKKIPAAKVTVESFDTVAQMVIAIQAV
jgi:acyl carrier protein